MFIEQCNWLNEYLMPLLPTFHSICHFQPNPLLLCRLLHHLLTNFIFSYGTPFPPSCRASGVVVREPGCWDVKQLHGCQTVHPWPLQLLNGSALKNWQMGSARFNPRSRLLTQPFGVFRDFPQNSGKYGLGSLRKTPKDGIQSISLGPPRDNRL